MRSIRTTPFIRGTVFAATALLAVACYDATGTDRSVTRINAADSIRADSVARARQDSINRTLPGYVVDSILPPAEELRRFRAALGGTPVERLAGGSDSRDMLVRRFLESLAARDTAALTSLAMTAREFADLYYPESPYARPPYRQSPALAWELIQNPSHAGLAKLLRRLGGRQQELLGIACEPNQPHEGRSTRYTGCLVHLRDAQGARVTRRLFGSIIERDGRFKFVSYTNQF